MRKDELITSDNVVIMAERIASRALKTILCYNGNRRLRKLYRELNDDIAKKNDPEHVFSDGYDLAQSAACFLWQYVGMPLNKECAYTVRGKQTTILDACFSRINQMLMKERKNSYVLASNNCPEVINLSVPFEEPQEEPDYTVVDETIAKLNLSDGEHDVLNCYLNGMGFEQTVAYLSVAVSTVWNRRKRIQRKYNFLMGTDY